MKSPTCASGLRSRARPERNLLGEVLDRLDDLHQPLQLHLAGGRVDVGADVGLLAVAGARRLLDRVRHRGDDDLLVDRLLAGDRVGDLQKLEPVCTDCHFGLPCHAGMPPDAESIPRSGSASSSPARAARRFLRFLPRLLVLLERVADQVVGQHQARLGDGLERHPHDRLPRLRPAASRSMTTASSPTSAILPRKRLRSATRIEVSSLTRWPIPVREIGLAHQRPVDARRRDFEMIRLVERIIDVEHRRDGAAGLLAVLDGHRAVVALGHDLQGQAVLRRAGAPAPAGNRWRAAPARRSPRRAHRRRFRG